MTATRLSQKLLSKTCNLSFPQRGTGVSKENTTNTFIACGTWLKTPFYTSSAGVELPLGTQRIPHPLSLLFKSGAYLCGQMCLHKLVSTLSSSEIKNFCLWRDRDDRSLFLRTLLDFLDEGAHEGGHVVRPAGGDHALVNHHFLVHPVGARVDQVILDGLGGGQLHALGNAS